MENRTWIWGTVSRVVSWGPEPRGEKSRFRLWYLWFYVARRLATDRGRRDFSVKMVNGDANLRVVK
jgi:hypothetical protein